MIFYYRKSTTDVAVEQALSALVYPDLTGMSPNSFQPSIITDHSTAIALSQSMLMNCLSLTTRV
ncbi:MULTISPECIES: hypothetical protein [unclassified Mesorhizobium]|uniref:hypothetical protein n=1 Tax=unclassified Mesorhizobium TaxID=325217 RepID=UPI000412C1C5|nr:hypothetical protein [Mesorhizobium sp. LSJC255A00]